MMKAEDEISAPSLPIYYGAVLWPYFIIGVGLYVWQSAWLAIGGYHLGMAIGLSLARWPIRRPNLRWPWRVQLLVGLTCLGSLLAGPLIVALWPWLAKWPNLALEPFLSAWGLTDQKLSIFGWYFCLVNPWQEEIYWRDWLGNTSTRTWETAAWFAGYHGLVLLPLLHWEWIGLVLVILTVTGWWWSQLMKLGSGLAGPVLCHLAADVSIILALNKLY
jgi:hypothetical protein